MLYEAEFVLCRIRGSQMRPTSIKETRVFATPDDIAAASCDVVEYMLPANLESKPFAVLRTVRFANTLNSPTQTDYIAGLPEELPYAHWYAVPSDSQALAKLWEVRPYAGYQSK